jgi:hypothetical protein
MHALRIFIGTRIRKRHVGRLGYRWNDNVGLDSSGFGIVSVCCVNAVIDGATSRSVTILFQLIVERRSEHDPCLNSNVSHQLHTLFVRELLDI